jgi:hypothetical protein
MLNTRTVIIVVGIAVIAAAVFAGAISVGQAAAQRAFGMWSVGREMPLISKIGKDVVIEFRPDMMGISLDTVGAVSGRTVGASLYVRGQLVAVHPEWLVVETSVVDLYDPAGSLRREQERVPMSSVLLVRLSSDANK